MDTSRIQNLIASGAMFVVNHSGGKDSQAMYLMLRDLVPRDQLVIVHADLGAVEWAGALNHIIATTRGERIETCRSRRSLLEMIEERGMFPSPQQRQCTSDLKRGPIERTIRGLVTERIRKWCGNPDRPLGTDERRAAIEAGMALVVNCMGMRTEESPGRSKLTPFKLNAGNSLAGREWYDWLPVHDWSERQVFEMIASRGQKPHIVYELGMSRFSCCFCIMASEADLKTAARLATERPELLNDPHLYAKYVQLERSTGQVMLMPKTRKGQAPLRLTLEDVTGVKADLSVLEAA